jgi:YbbR domain-containing protein
LDRLLGNEWLVRLLALVLAILVYVQAQGTGGGTAQRTIDGVPVQALGVPPNLVVLSVQPQTVQVTVSGPLALINRLNTSEFTAWVNVAGASVGSQAFFAQVSVPSGVQLVTYNPADISVTTDQKKQQMTPVVARLQGQPAEGFAVAGAPDVEPADVVLQGPQSAVDRVAQTQVTIPVDGRRAGSFTVNAEPQPVDASGRVVPGVDVAPSTVNVTVTVSAVAVQRSLTVQAALTGQPAAGYRVTAVSVSPPAVTVAGPGNALAGVTSAGTGPVSVAGATGPVHVLVPVVPPQGAMSVVPAQVAVTVDVSKA